jgi:hypothetical protein
MAGNLFAPAMLAMVAATFAMLKVEGKRPTLRSTLVGILTTLASFVVLASMNSVHGCLRGGTVTPELFAAILDRINRLRAVPAMVPL